MRKREPKKGDEKRGVKFDVTGSQERNPIFSGRCWTAKCPRCDTSIKGLITFVIPLVQPLYVRTALTKPFYSFITDRAACKGATTATPWI